MRYGFRKEALGVGPFRPDGDFRLGITGNVGMSVIENPRPEADRL
jgi:hypothetical protein